jgi:hypothetical protein
MLAGLAGVSASKSPTRIGSALAVAPATVAQTSAPAAATTTHKIIYDECALMIDGKRTYVWSGEFRYWRLPSPSL